MVWKKGLEVLYAYLSVMIWRTSVGVSLQVNGPELESQYSIISLTC